jgi:hypothetical protein
MNSSHSSNLYPELMHCHLINNIEQHTNSTTLTHYSITKVVIELLGQLPFILDLVCKF